MKVYSINPFMIAAPKFNNKNVNFKGDEKTEEGRNYLREFLEKNPNSTEEGLKDAAARCRVSVEYYAKCLLELEKPA